MRQLVEMPPKHIKELLLTALRLRIFGKTTQNWQEMHGEIEGIL
jgi:hypothetical protein